MFKKAFLTVFALISLSLAGCGEAEDKIRIGSKNFGESRVLAEMMAAVVREQGLAVDGVVEYANTQTILEALKRGDIDAYPEYNGTGLVMLGQAPLTDGDAALARVKEVYEPLGISWRKRFGFANNYGLAMLPARVAELDVETMSDLAGISDQVTLGIEDDFDSRPLDGLTPMTQRYGFEFASVEEVSLSERGRLYDMLLDGEVDVIEVFTTDGQLADFGLTLLEDDLSFFPVYQATPVVRQDSLTAHPRLGEALDALGGTFDAAGMQELNRKVDLEGRSPGAVARDALARAGLVEAGAVEAEEPLKITAVPASAENELASDALRAARKAFSGRGVEVIANASPLDQVASGGSRLALVGTESFFDFSKPAPVRDNRFEALAAIGSNAIHLVSKGDTEGVSSLDQAKTIAVGPEGSASHRLGGVLIKGLGLSAELVPQPGGSVSDLVGAVAGDADVAVIPAPVGDRAVALAFSENVLRLLPVEGWSGGANLVRYPFLRATRVPANTYERQFAAIETLASQVVLAGPAPGIEASQIGEQGPGATAAPSLKPVPTSTVKALAASIEGAELIDPTLRLAAAFAPELPEPPAAMNPSADVSFLNIALVLLFVWVFWLYARPEYR